MFVLFDFLFSFFFLSENRKRRSKVWGRCRNESILDLDLGLFIRRIFKVEK